MEPVAWMFEGSPDVDADVEMMLELRTELSELVKVSEKITAVGRGQASFGETAAHLKGVALEAKEPVGFDFFVVDLQALREMEIPNKR